MGGTTKRINYDWFCAECNFKGYTTTFNDRKQASDGENMKEKKKYCKKCLKEDETPGRSAIFKAKKAKTSS